MSKIRIIAMDGGGVLSVTSLLLLERMAAMEPELLPRANVWSGNSAGAINALRLAMPGMSSVEQVAAIDQCIAFWRDDFDHLIHRRPVGELCALAGQLPFYETRKLHAYLAEHFYGSTRLEQMAPVAVTTLKLDAVQPDVLGSPGHVEREPDAHRSVLPQVVHNFTPVVDLADRDMERFSPRCRAVDLAVASSSAPVMAPIFSNHVDGALFANNPSMCTLAAALNAYHVTPQDAVILSLGAGANPRYVQTTKRYEEWGYAPWLLDPQRPLLLLQVFIDAVTATVDYQCRNLLGEDAYVRLNPILPEEVDTTSRHALAFDTAVAAAASVSDQELRACLARLRKAGWFSDERPVLRAQRRAESGASPTEAPQP